MDINPTHFVGFGDKLFSSRFWLTAVAIRSLVDHVTNDCQPHDYQ